MKSMVNEARLSVRFKTEDYSWEEYTLGAVVDERETGKQVLRELKLQINEVFTGSTEQAEEVVAEKPKKEEEKKNAKPSKSSPVKNESNDDEADEEEDSGDDVESDKDDEAADDETGNDSDDSSDESEDDADDSEDEEEEPKPAKSKSSKPGKGKKGFKAKPQAYNRAIEPHKEIFSGVLRSVSPDWKKSDKLKALAKAASSAMEGEDFLDGNGEVLPEFRAAVVKLMKAKK